MRLPGLLRPSPTLADLEGRLLDTLQQGTTAPHHWTVWLCERDLTRCADERDRWSARLVEVLEAHLHRLARVPAGAVTVALRSAPDVPPGRFRVTGTSTPDVAEVDAAVPLPGRPRLTIPAGGTARWGSSLADGVENDRALAAGRQVIGRDPRAEIHLDDMTLSPRHAELIVSATGDLVRLRDLGSLNGTAVDGVPAVVVDLVNGNRIQLGGVTLVFQCDPTGEEASDYGRQGGELS